MSDRMKTVLAIIAAVIFVGCVIVGLLSERADCKAKGGEFLQGFYSAYQC